MFNKLVMNGKEIQLYYHKTSGEAEYLLDTFIECPNGHKEGMICLESKVVIRIDGNELEICRLEI